MDGGSLGEDDTVSAWEVCSEGYVERPREEVDRGGDDYVECAGSG